MTHRRPRAVVRCATRRLIGLVVVVVVAIALAGCGNDDGAGGATTAATGPAATDDAEDAGFDIDPAVPDDPAALPACDTLDTPGDRQVPSRWWAGSLPDGTTVAVAGTTLRAQTPAPGSGIQVLVATDDDGEVTAEVVVEVDPLDEPGATPGGFEPDSTLRGVPAQLATSDGSSGPAGVVTARWVEDGRSWTLAAAGLEEVEVVQVVEALELTDEGVAAPTGVLREVAAAPGRYPVVRTEIGLAADGASPRELGVVVEEHDGGTGLPMITGLLPRTGLELGTLGDRPALRGELSGSQVLMTTTVDGAAVYAYGPFDPEELDELVGSLERVDADDRRLAGVPMDWTPAEGRFCREG